MPIMPAAEIHDAAENNNSKALETLLKQDAKLAQLKDEAGDLPIHHAVQKGQLDAVKLLLSNGADVNARGFDDWTPLHWAAKTGSKAMCKFLLDHGADPKALNGVHRTPLQMANGAAMFFLRDLDAPPPAPPVVANRIPDRAVSSPPPKQMAAQNVLPVPPKPVTAPEQAKSDLQKMLLAAIENKSAGNLEALLSKGGDANTRNKLQHCMSLLNPTSPRLPKS